MLTKLLKKFGVIGSTVIITLAAIIASVALSLIIGTIVGGAEFFSILIPSILCPLIITPPIVFFYSKMSLNLDRSREDLELVNKELSEALADVNTLTGLLPICWSCRKIRDDTGYWNQLEHYITDRSNACFVRGLCEECAEKSPWLAQPLTNMAKDRRQVISNPKRSSLETSARPAPVNPDTVPPTE